ncbi:MAG TPA: SulP family inorganic anion transporter [Actinomycetales bacterium]|nr:SulP family inorganic anion transporter [Actinomycetales bacterium]
MTAVVRRLLPGWLRGYRREWMSRDVVAGVTLAAVAIPECMGYTSIAQTPIATGLYTVIFPTIVFALLGSSKLLVVGADSATAAILAAGLAGLTVPGLTPASSEWVAFSSLVALVCGGMLLLARLLRLGFLGDFLSASVLIGFLTGVGIQVMGGQVPDMLGVPKGGGRWLEQQWDWITEVPNASVPTIAFALGTLVISLGFKRFSPRIPGAIVAVVLSIIISAATDAKAHGVAVVGSVERGLPPIGLPPGISWDDVPRVLGIAFACFVLIIAQSAATSRSFAMRHGDRVDVNRDIVGLAGANVAAGLSGTFVVNGSPTKTQILDGQKGRTQLANLTMSAAVLIVVLVATAVLDDMPKAVLATIVFLIGIDLIDLLGLRLLARRRWSEFLIAAITCVVVFAVGVEQAIILAVILSVLDLVRRQYSPRDFIIRPDGRGGVVYEKAVTGRESLPGLIIYRYDAQLFYANANRFVDDAEAIIEAAPEPVRWFVLDAGSIDDVDYSAGISLGRLLDYVTSRNITFGLARLDESLSTTLGMYGLLDRIPTDHRFSTLEEALAAFRADAGPRSVAAG